MKRLIAISLMTLLISANVWGEEMRVRFYVAPQQGTGTHNDPYRSILNDMIDITKGEWFDEMDNPARRISICAVHAEDATHQAISADNRVIPASTLMLESDKSALDQTFSEDAAKTRLEAIGVNTGWISQFNTRRDVLRYVIKLFAASQIADGMGSVAMKKLLALNLNSTIADLTLAERNAAKTWIENRGLTTDWMKATTTIREVLHYLVSELMIGRIKLSGEDF